MDRRGARRAAVPGVGIADAWAGGPSLAGVPRLACACAGAILSWLGRGYGSRGPPRCAGRDDRRDLGLPGGASRAWGRSRVAAWLFLIMGLTPGALALMCGLGCAFLAARGAIRWAGIE
eukprot:823454-Alexandrium_andersonii.AAC.1